MRSWIVVYRILRRLYSGMGLIAIVVAARFARLAGRRPFGALVSPISVFQPLILGLVLLIATARIEPEKAWRTFLVNVLGGIGAILILAALGIGLVSRLTAFLPGEGAVYLILGLFFIGALPYHAAGQR